MAPTNVKQTDATTDGMTYMNHHTLPAGKKKKNEEKKGLQGALPLWKMPPQEYTYLAEFMEGHHRPCGTLVLSQPNSQTYKVCSLFL